MLKKDRSERFVLSSAAGLVIDNSQAVPLRDGRGKSPRRGARTIPKRGIGATPTVTVRAASNVGLGRVLAATRSAAIARVAVRSGSGRIMVNGLDLDDFFLRSVAQQVVKSALGGQQQVYDVICRVSRGPELAKAEAIRNGIKRALVQLHADGPVGARMGRSREVPVRTMHRLGVLVPSLSRAEQEL